MSEPQIAVYCAINQDISWEKYVCCLYRDEVAVFRFDLLDGIFHLPYMQTLLLADEMDRARRFRRIEDQNRYAVTRGLVRILGGKYLNQPPAGVQFIRSENQKPDLQHDCGWHINVAHSGTYIAVAVSKGEVGIDTEKIDAAFSFEDVATHSFGLAEQQYISEGQDNRLRFYQLWTRKEALVKATGTGIDDNFVRVPCLPGMHRIAGHLIGTHTDWNVTGFELATGYPAAVAHWFTGESIKFYSVDGGIFTNYES